MESYGISAEKYNSFVNRFHVLLKECGEDSYPNAKKTSILFKVYNEVLEHLGVFKEIMTEIRNGLIESVYSEQLTTADDEEPCIERIPFYLLTRKIEREATQVSDTFQIHLDVVQEKLFNKQRDYEKVVQDMALLTEAMNQLNLENEDLENTIQSRNDDIDRIYGEMDSERKTFEQKENELQNEMNELKKELDKVTQERNSLQPYKDGFDKMKTGFEKKNLENATQPRKKPVLSSRKNNVLSSIEAAMILKDQLLRVENKTLEDYEQYIERHRQKISLESGQCFNTDSSSNVDKDDELTESIAEEADLELLNIQANFRRNCVDIDRELLSLERHCDMLKEQLQTMEEFKTKEKNEGTELFKAIAQGKYKGGRPGDDGDIAEDPFTVKERVLSKYSASMFISYNKGKSFLEVVQNTYCRSCADKTLICPHKITKHDSVIEIPKDATHIKFCRPSVNINQKLIDRTLGLVESVNPELKSKEVTQISVAQSETVSKPSDNVDAAEVVQRVVNEDDEIEQKERTQSAKTDATKLLEEEEEEDEDFIAINSFDLLWEDLKERSPNNKKTPRSIDINRVKSTVEQFWATVLWEDNNSSKFIEENNLLEKFYTFMNDRFQLKEISHMAVADFFLTFIGETIHENQTLRCFAHILVNNLDGASFRYLLVVYDLIEDVKWVHVEQFRIFLPILYPFLNEDEIESLQLGYISYCENKVSKQSICDYIAYLLLKGQEPRFMEMENRLMQANHIGGYMKEQDFTLFMETILEEVDLRLTMKLFQQTSRSKMGLEKRAEGMVHVQKLTQIGSYLCLLMAQNQMHEDIKSKLMQPIRKYSGEEQDTDAFIDLTAIIGKPDIHLKWTYGNFMKLSNDVARSVAYRQKMLDAPSRDY